MAEIETERLLLAPDKVSSLLRRWNQQVNHLERTDELPPHRLDCIAPSHQAFSASRLRSNLQRCFLALHQLRDVGRAVMRLRSWDDPLRTGTACAAYFFAWLSPIGVFQFLVLTLIALVLSPTFCLCLFPPITAAKPSTTLDAEVPTKGENPDLLAHEFTEGLSELAVMGGSTTTLSEVGQGEVWAPSADDEAQCDSDETVEEEDVHFSDTELDTPSVIVSAAAKGKRRKTPKEVKIRRIARLERFGLPLQRVAGALSDFLEKLFNALNPPPPFPENDGRIAIARHLAIIPLLGLLFPPGVIMSALSFLVGIAFFGNPLFKIVAEILDERVPDWKLRFKNRHTMMDPAPTDLQLTIRLLRDAEKAGAPLHPPPPLPRRSRTLPAKSEDPIHSEDPSLRKGPILETDEISDSPLPTSSSLRSRLGLFNSSRSSLVDEPAEISGERGSFGRGWEKVSKRAAEKVRAATLKLDHSMTERLKQREMAKEEMSRSNFLAHRGGVPGHLVISLPAVAVKNSDKISRTLSFVRIASSSSASSTNVPSSSRLSNIVIPLCSVTSLRKVSSGVSWRGNVAYELLVGASSSGKGRRGGIKVSWRDDDAEERTEVFGGVKRRDELFNRLSGLIEGKFLSL